MSDFTRDELRMILLDMEISIIKAPPLKPSPIYLALRDKVQSMIENYCEHDDTYHCDYCGIISCEQCKEPCGGELIDG
jgi:hypothetical protein